MSDDNIETAVQRVVAMKHAGMNDKSIAAAAGISLETLEKVYEKDEYAQAVAQLAENEAAKFNTLNEGWDMIESEAMNKVMEHVQKMPDPDFALRAAAVANKAQRRGRHNNNPIAAIPNAQVTIQLTANFADRMQTDFAISERKPEAIEKKDNNFLAPKAVQALLGKVIKPHADSQVEAEFANFQPV